MTDAPSDHFQDYRLNSELIISMDFQRSATDTNHLEKEGVEPT